MKVVIKTVKGEKLQLECEPTDKIEALKEAISQKM